MLYRAHVADPRDPTGEARLDVVYAARPGRPADRTDPTEDPEYRLDEALTKRGGCVLPRLSPGQYAALEDAIHQQHQF